MSPADNSSLPVTRRTLLRAGAGVGALGVLSGAGATVAHDAALPTAPSPEPDTWPLARYGPRNTARNPNADPPDDPAVETHSTAPDGTTLVVAGNGDSRRIVAGGYEGVVAHRPDGSVAWRGPESDVVAARPGDDVCYVPVGEDGGLQARGLTDGTVRWRSDLAHASVYSVVPTSDGLFVPFNGGIDVYDGDGTHRYTVARGDGIGYADAAVADGVYVVDVGMVERLRPRGLLRELRGRPPAAAWRVEQGLVFSQTVAVDSGEVFVADKQEGGQGGVLAVDASGSVPWERELGVRPTGMAVGPDRVFVGMDEHPRGASGDSTYGLYALDKGNGETVWSVEESEYYADPVLAGDALVVGEGTRSGDGRVRAFDRGGDPRWSVNVEGVVRDLAPVGDRIYALTGSARLSVLS